MTRETWPEDYHKPEWLRCLQDGLYERRTDLWKGIWIGAFWTSAAVLFASFVTYYEKIEELPRMSGVFELVAVVSVLGWMLTTNDHDNSYSDFLRYKAEAAAWSGQWTPNQLSEAEQVYEWTVSSWRNTADREFANRQVTWARKTFWKLVGGGKVQKPQFWMPVSGHFLGCFVTALSQRFAVERIRQDSR